MVINTSGPVLSQVGLLFCGSIYGSTQSFMHVVFSTDWKNTNDGNITDLNEGKGIYNKNKNTSF